VDWNLVGMVLNFGGGVLLSIFALPALNVTRTGQTITGFVDGGTGEGRRKYWIYTIGSRTGLLMMTAGFGLQLYSYQPLR
jgi:hypothetical protein